MEQIKSEKRYIIWFESTNHMEHLFTLEELICNQTKEIQTLYEQINILNDKLKVYESIHQISIQENCDSSQTNIAPEITNVLRQMCSEEELLLRFTHLPSEYEAFINTFITEINRQIPYDTVNSVYSPVINEVPYFKYVGNLHLLYTLCKYYNKYTQEDINKISHMIEKTFYSLYQIPIYIKGNQRQVKSNECDDKDKLSCDRVTYDAESSNTLVKDDGNLQEKGDDTVPYDACASGEGGLYLQQLPRNQLYAYMIEKGYIVFIKNSKDELLKILEEPMWKTWKIPSLKWLCYVLNISPAGTKGKLLDRLKELDEETVSQKANECWFESCRIETDEIERLSDKIIRDGCLSLKKSF